MEHNLETKFNISSNSIPMRVSRLEFFTVNFVYEDVICKKKHFFPAYSTRLALRLCDTFGMLLCMEIVHNSWRSESNPPPDFWDFYF